MANCVVEAQQELIEYVMPVSRARPMWHYKLAIAKFLVEYIRWLDIRMLWRSGSTTFFRVNHWSMGDRVGDASITRSEFLAVDDSRKGLNVRRVTANSV